MTRPDREALPRDASLRADQASNVLLPQDRVGYSDPQSDTLSRYGSISSIVQPAHLDGGQHVLLAWRPGGAEIQFTMIGGDRRTQRALPRVCLP